ncbi:methyltransferase domain-containing protein [Candidatus Uhrbacteria bacterium]|nr:methyltransferase domain-containing protein [Candidatus Uhrbacteria bacterium]
MYPSRDYHTYTNYHLEPAGLTRLDFFMDAIEVWSRAHPGVTPAILDVGCGNGNIALPLASKGWWVDGIDTDAQSIAAVNERNVFPTLHVAVADIETWKPERTYDVILVSEFLEHVADPGRVLAKAATMLTSGGLLIGSVPNGWSLEEGLRRLLQRTGSGRNMKRGLRSTILPHEIVQSHAESPHVQYFSWGRLHPLVRDAGFVVRERVSSSIFFHGLYYIVGRFCMTRGSRLFHFLDAIDTFLAPYFPRWMGEGWLFACAKRNSKS